jgi:hypothetical protein
MKTFRQFISETTYRRKGWLNINTGKMILFAFRGASIRPFHDEYVANNADKFIRGGEKVLLRKFADANGFAPDDEETMDMWNDIKDGKIDRDVNLDSILEEEGWRRVLFDEGISAVEPRNRQEAKKMVQMILDKIPWSKIESLLVYDTGTLSGGTDIYSEEDAITYAKTGRVPRRTDIGNTMAMFRGESVNEQAIKGTMVKGWMTPRGKVVLHPESSNHKFHLQILTQLVPFEKMRPFMADQIGKDLVDSMQGVSDFTQDQMSELVEREYQRVYKMWASAVVDQDRVVEGKFAEMGWVKIVIDRNQYGMSAIEGSDKQILKCAKKLDGIFGGWEGLETKAMMVSVKTSVSRMGSAIRDSGTWDNYLKTGKVRQQTEIGRKMAMFRGESIMEAGWNVTGYIVGPNGKWFKINENTHSDWVHKHYKKIGVVKKGNYDIFVEDAIKQNAVRIVFRENVLEMVCREGALTPKVRKALSDLYEKETYGARVWVYVASEEEGGDDGEDGRLLHNFADPSDAMEYFERGKVVKRSDIGRTMAMFR